MVSIFTIFSVIKGGFVKERNWNRVYFYVLTYFYATIPVIETATIALRAVTYAIST